MDYNASFQTRKCVLHFFTHNFLLSNKTEALLHFFVPTCAPSAQTPTDIFSCCPSSLGTPYSSAPSCVGKVDCTLSPDQGELSLTAEKMRSRRSYSGINTKRRIDFLWIKNLSVWEKPEGFSLRETLGKHVLYIDFHDQLWKNIILHLIKTGIFRMKFPFTPDSG